MCFLDITGFTRLTRNAAMPLPPARRGLSRVVQRTSVEHGGRPVKWLGDGVMFFFPDPGPGVVAALEMVDGVAAAGLPPAHVGLHAGPVLLQQGDYYGQTVNVASRIGEYARPGEVLVSQAVVDACTEVPVSSARSVRWNSRARRKRSTCTSPPAHSEAPGTRQWCVEEPHRCNRTVPRGPRLATVRRSRPSHEAGSALI